MDVLAHQFAATFQRMLDKYAESGIQIDLQKIRIVPELRLYGNLPACYYLSAQQVHNARFVIIGAKHTGELPIPFDSRLYDADAVSHNIAQVFNLTKGNNSVLENAYNEGVHLLNLIPIRLYYANTPLDITVIKPWYDLLLSYLETVRLKSPDVRYIFVGSRLKSYVRNKLPKAIAEKSHYLTLPKDVSSTQQWQVYLNRGA